VAYSEYAVDFDGSNDYATAGDVLAFERTDAFSVAFWVRGVTGDDGYLLGKQGPVPEYRGWGIYLNNAGESAFVLRYDYAILDQLVVYTVGADAGGRWTHIVWTYDGSNTPAGVICYINGSPAPMTTTANALTDTTVTTDPFWLGGCQSPSVGWLLEGRLSEVAIYSKALSAGEVTWIYNAAVPRDPRGAGAPSDLLAYWSMGDGDTYPILQDRANTFSFPTVQDKTVNSNDGAMTNMAAGDVIADSAGGHWSTHCIEFDGSNQYVSMGNVLDKDYDDAYSIVAWAKWTSPADMVLVGKRDGSDRGYWLAVTSGGAMNAGAMNTPITAAANVVTNSTGWNDGAWHQVVLTKGTSSAASSWKIYVDGSLQTLAAPIWDTLGTSTTSNTGIFSISSSNGSAYFFNGRLDEVAIYSKELAAADITWLWNLGVPRDLTETTAPTNLEGYWRMGEPPLNATMTGMAVADIVVDVIAGIPGVGSDDLTGGTAAEGAYAGIVTNLGGGGGAGLVPKFKMRAQQELTPVPIPPPGFVTWVSTGFPDFTGTGFSGGAPTPSNPMIAGSAIVADEWEE